MRKELEQLGCKFDSNLKPILPEGVATPNGKLVPAPVRLCRLGLHVCMSAARSLGDLAALRYYLRRPCDRARVRGPSPKTKTCSSGKPRASKTEVLSLFQPHDTHHIRFHTSHVTRRTSHTLVALVEHAVNPSNLYLSHTTRECHNSKSHMLSPALHTPHFTRTHTIHIPQHVATRRLELPSTSLGFASLPRLTRLLHLCLGTSRPIV